MTAETLRRVTFHGGSAELRTARRRRRCSARDGYPYPCAGIEVGDRYVRSVMFPNHDASGYDVPVAHDTCLDCAMNYLDLMDLAIAHRRSENHSFRPESGGER